ncbi:uncharacterized protein LOC143902896 [Temnothorax americanus]|uniref:uncharacterized protein LOC143902896 n=1 Tax=Temnothorax americanus TaxID=1964332 RepID=UPI0040696F50
MSDELQDDQNSNVSESGVITVEMTENVTKSHSVMPEGLQPNVNIDEKISNTSPVTENLIQNQMSDELQAMENIPSPFRKSLVWPADIMKNKKNKKKPARKVSTDFRRVAKATITNTRRKVKKAKRDRRTKKA